MSSPGNSYGSTVRRFVAGYLLSCVAVLLALLVADLFFPQAQVYPRLASAFASAAKSLLSAAP